MHIDCTQVSKSTCARLPAGGGRVDEFLVRLAMGCDLARSRQSPVTVTTVTTFVITPRHGYLVHSSLFSSQYHHHHSFPRRFHPESSRFGQHKLSAQSRVRCIHSSQLDSTAPLRRLPITQPRAPCSPAPTDFCLFTPILHFYCCQDAAYPQERC